MSERSLTDSGRAALYAALLGEFGQWLARELGEHDLRTGDQLNIEFSSVLRIGRGCDPEKPVVKMSGLGNGTVQ